MTIEHQTPQNNQVGSNMHCGFVAVLGQPNAGKSTLVNAITGHKVSIVSPKVQTTRRRVLGIQMLDNAQLILVDTPGLFTPKRPLESAIVKDAWQAPKDADVVLYIVDVTRKNTQEDLELIAKVPAHLPLLIAFNKVDAIAKEKLLEIAQPFNELNRAQHFFMISALNGVGVKDMLEKIKSYLPQGPWLFDVDQVSDAPKKRWASELTREQVYLQLDNELPYEIFVETDSYEILKDGSVKIHQTIVVAKQTQKAIVVGKQGSRIKSINIRARGQMQYFLQQKVHLFLFVKVEENWMDKPKYLQEIFAS